MCGCYCAFFLRSLHPSPFPYTRQYKSPQFFVKGEKPKKNPPEIPGELTANLYGVCGLSDVVGFGRLGRSEEETEQRLDCCQEKDENEDHRETPAATAGEKFKMPENKHCDRQKNEEGDEQV